MEFTTNSFDQFIGTYSVLSTAAGKASKRFWAILSSEKAQDFYRAVITVVALMVAVIAIVVYRAVKQVWANREAIGKIVLHRSASVVAQAKPQIKAKLTKVVEVKDKVFAATISGPIMQWLWMEIGLTE